MNYKKDTFNNLSLIGHNSAAGMTSFSITLQKKCERLATAIYLVTNFLSDTEPMKARLRILSLDFVRDASLLKNGSRTVEVSVLDALRGNISEVLSLLELALVAGLVSEMNFTLLKREYISLRDMIDVKKSSHESLTDNVLGDNFFGSSFHTEENISAPTIAHAPASSSRSVFTSATKQSSTPAPATRTVFASASARDVNLLVQKHPGYQNGHMDVSSNGHSSGKSNGHLTKTPAPAPIPNPKSHILNPTHSTHAPRAITDVAKESRRARILKLIKDNREVAIRDIVNHFPDLSEKTIQRELVTMSDSGVLKKSGERRWSRYALV